MDNFLVKFFHYGIVTFLLCPGMKFSISETNDSAVVVSDHGNFKDEEIIEQFGKYGKIESIISDNEKQIIYFSTPKEAEECVKEAHKMRSARLKFCNFLKFC